MPKTVTTGAPKAPKASRHANVPRRQPPRHAPPMFRWKGSSSDSAAGFLPVCHESSCTTLDLRDAPALMASSSITSSSRCTTSGCLASSSALSAPALPEAVGVINAADSLIDAESLAFGAIEIESDSEAAADDEADVSEEPNQLLLAGVSATAADDDWASVAAALPRAGVVGFCR